MRRLLLWAFGCASIGGGACVLTEQFIILDHWRGRPVMFGGSMVIFGILILREEVLELMRRKDEV